MIYKKEVPYLLTILFIVLGWTINQTVTNLSQTPIIEYDINTNPENGKIKHTIVLTNISLDKAFTDLVVRLKTPKVSEAKLECHLKPKTNYLSPTTAGDPSEYVHPKPCSNKEGSIRQYTEHTIEKLQPNASVELITYTDKITKIEVGLWSNEAVNLIEQDLKTISIKYQFNILIGLIVLLFILIISYIFFTKKESK